MAATYFLSNFSLNEVEYFYIPEVIDLCKVIINDFTCYRILNDFFIITTSNHGISSERAAYYLDSSKEIFEQMENQTINLNIYNNLKEKVINLFNSNYNTNQYSRICSNYLEYIVNMWKKIPDTNGIIASEPEIFYNSQLIFSDSDFCRSKFDIVYLHKQNKQLNLYECKFRLISFINNLTYYSECPNIQRDRKHRNAVRKKQYMEAFHNLFENNEIDTNEGEVAIVTLARFSEIQNDIPLLSPLHIYTRDYLETKDVFNNFYI